MALDRYGGYAAIPFTGTYLKGSPGFFRTGVMGERVVIVDPGGNVWPALSVWNASIQGSISPKATDIIGGIARGHQYYAQQKYGEVGHGPVWAMHTIHRLKLYGFNSIQAYGHSILTAVGGTGTAAPTWFNQDPRPPGGTVDWQYGFNDTGQSTPNNLRTRGFAPIPNPHPMVDFGPANPRTPSRADTTAFKPFIRLNAAHITHNTNFLAQGGKVFSPDIFSPGWLSTVQGQANHFKDYRWRLGYLMDDADYVRGMGPGPSGDFLAPDGKNHLHLGWCAATGKFWMTQGVTFDNVIKTYTDPLNYTKRAFIVEMINKYGTITNLNDAWGTGGFYTTFDEQDPIGHTSWGTGTGLADEDGRHTWMGGPTSVNRTEISRGNVYMLPTAVAQDLDNFVYSFAVRYLSSMRNAIKNSAPNMLFLGNMVLGGWGRPPHRNVIRAIGEYVDVWNGGIGSVWDPIPLLQSMYDFIGTHIGTPVPIVNWINSHAVQDSSMIGQNPDVGSPTQEARAIRYRNYLIDGMAKIKSNTMGLYLACGVNWWAGYDQWNEKGNYGLTTYRENVYNGIDCVISPPPTETVTYAPFPFVAHEGSPTLAHQWAAFNRTFINHFEDGDWGDFISGVRVAHTELEQVFAVQTGTPTVPDTTPPTQPGVIAATRFARSLNLVWAASTDNRGVANYRVSSRITGSGAAFVLAGSPTTTSFLLSNLQPETSYDISIIAVDTAPPSQAPPGPNVSIARTGVFVTLAEVGLPLLFTETFPGGDHASILDGDRDWTDVVVGFGKTSNRAQLQTAVENATQRMESAVTTVNQFIEGTLSLFTEGSGRAMQGIAARYAAAANTKYCLQAESLQGSKQYAIRRVVDGAAAVENFPLVVGRTDAHTSLNTPTFTLNIPAPDASNPTGASDMLLSVISQDGGSPYTWPVGWNSIPNAAVTVGTSIVRQEARYRIADGTEGASIVVSATSEQWCGRMLRIHNHNGQAPQAASASGAGVNANPPNLTPSGGSKKYLFVIAAAWDNFGSVSAYPAGYSQGHYGQNEPPTGGGWASHAMAERLLEAASENPDVLTSAAEDWIAFTIAITPAPAEAPLLSIAQDPIIGDRMRFEIEGDDPVVLTAIVNGQNIGSVEDNNVTKITTGNRSGITGSMGTGGSVAIDNITFGDLDQGTPTDPPDPPVVVITSPADDTIVSGELTVTVTATDPNTVGLASIRLFVDDNIYNVRVSSPASFLVDTTLLTDGIHDLRAQAVDNIGGIGDSAEIQIIIANNTQRRGQISWFEFEVPDPPVTDRRGQISWFEFEVPDRPTPVASIWELKIGCLRKESAIGYVFKVDGVEVASLGQTPENINPEHVVNIEVTQRRYVSVEAACIYSGPVVGRFTATGRYFRPDPFEAPQGLQIIDQKFIP